jgi:hypothetical protein
VLRFSYGAGDSSSKPAQISVEGVGAITMTYAPSGEVKMVDSSGGRGTSMAVTETFQEISDLIRPAEVSTGF